MTLEKKFTASRGFAFFCVFFFPNDAQQCYQPVTIGKRTSPRVLSALTRTLQEGRGDNVVVYVETHADTTTGQLFIKANSTEPAQAVSISLVKMH